MLNGDGTITFTPDADYNGTASFEYTIADDGTTNAVPDSLTAVGTVNLNIAGVNDVPTAGADGITVSEDSTTTLDVLSNDSIAPDFGETLSIVSVGTGSAGGTISITNGGADLSYTPAADFVGTETFTYTINDGTPGSTDQATVTITVTEVNDVPITADDLVTTSEDNALTFNAADLLLNDTTGPANESDQTLTVTAVSATADTHGTVVLNGDGTITYTPDANFNGTASFDYTATDDGATNGSPDAQSTTGTVNVTVSEVNDGPTANTDSIVAVEDTPLTFNASDLVVNDNAGPADESDQTLTVTAVSATVDTHGTVVLNGDGTITFTPDADFNGTASFDYTVSDNGTTEGLTDSLSDLGSVTVLVTEVNDATLTAGDTQSATEDTPLTFAASELLANDSTGPANESNQTLTVTAVTATADTHGTVVLNGDGTITFTPDTDFNGTASFEYTVSDNGTTAGAPDAKTASDTVTVNISAVNDAPTVVVPDTSADEGETVNLVATFTDPEPEDIHTAIIHWGDGTTEVGTVIEVNGSGTITGSHIYADNGNYTITVEVTDDGTPIEAASASGIAAIGNVAPYLSAGIGFSPVENGSDYEMSFVISGYFDDPGFDSLLANTSESFTMIIDWGDGTVINVTPAVTQGAEGLRTKGYFSESHVYTQTGTYNPTVTVTDDDGGTTSVTLGSILPISINVHPHIQLSAQGRLPVTVYGDQGVDLSLIDSSTVRFGPAGAPPTPGHGGWQLKGNGDVKAHFETQETGIRITDKVGFLTGQLTDGTFFIGMDVLDFAQGNKKGKGNAGVVTEDPNPAGDSKFFVADNGVHRVFRYDSAGASTDSIAVDSAARDVRGATVYDENPDDNIQPVLWTVGGTQQVAVQKVDGTLIGSWRAVGVEDPQGIATGGDDIWIVDAATHQVLRYVGYGHQSAFFGVGISSSSFALHQDNVSPSGITTDGDTIWVVDDVADRVFVYDVAGTYLGSWDLDPANSDAAGITIALNDSTSMWVVDRNDDRVYRYDDATGVRSGSLTAASTFDLIGDNLNPEGIADPDPNQAPVATNDTVSDVIGGVAEVIDVLANDTDPESDAISVTSVSTPLYGTAVINGDGTISYTGTIGFGTDTFTYTISDTSSATSTATVTVTETGNYPPTAVNDSVNDVLEGQAVVISVLSNDTDPESDTLSITALSTPAYGTAVDNGDGTITYTAGTGFSGDSFTYSISDGNGHTSTATVTIYEAVNQPPVAYSTTLDPVEAGVETIISVIANSTDPEADTLTVVSVSTPLNGTAVDNGDGTISYTGNASFGTDSFTYTISDGNGNTDTGTINVTELVDLPPIAADDFAYEVAGGSPVIIDVLGNDADPEAGTLAITSLSAPTSGMAVDNGDGTITYTGPLGFGSVSFSYTVSDPGGNTDTAIVSIYELIAVDDTVSVTAGSTVTIDVLTNDNYPSGTTLTLLSANGASHGTTTLQRRIPAALQTEFEGSMEYEMGESIDNYVLWYYGSWDDYAMMSGNDVSIFDVLYSSTDGNYVGTDTFNYVVQNDQGVQDTGTVTITVNANQAPVAGADTATVVAGNSVAIEVLSNDSDPEGSAVSLVSLGTATYGTVSLERRIPVALQTEFEGSMEYEMGESIDNYVLWYYGSWDDYAMMSGNDVNIFDVTYTSTDVNYSGTDSFTYTIEDEQGVQSTGTVTVTVTGNQAPDAVADTATVVAGNSVIVDVLANDSDPEGSAVSLVFLGAATHGTVTQQRRIPAALQTEYEGSWEYSEGYSIDDYVSMFYGSWEQYENSSGNDASTFDVTYTSTDGSYSGTDTFTYTIQDEQGVQSTGTVTVTVTGNQAPDAVADTATVVAGNSVVVDVLANDSDPEGGTVSLVSLGTAAHGTVALQRRIPAALQTEYEGSWEYSEGYSIDDYVSMFYGSWEQYEISSGNDATTFDVIYTSTDGSYSGTDSFTYTIQDEQGGQSIGTATVTVTGNQAPDAVADTATVVAGNSTVIDVLVNDSDPEGTPLSLVSLGTATYGTVTQERRIPAALQSEYEGSWEYAEGYSIDDYVSMYYGSWEQYENSSGYDATTFDVIYTSTDGSYTGTDSFTYTIQDEQGVQSTGTVTVTVINNQAPDAVADTATVVAGNSVVIDVLANDSDPEGTTVSLISLGTATYGTVTQQRRIPTSLQTEYEGSWEYSEGYSIDDYVSFMYGSWEQYQNSSGNDTSIFDVTYTSTDANYSGTDSFTYTIQDEQGVQSTGTVTVTITGNQAPDAVADTASVVAGNSVVIDVLANDSDPEGSAVSLMSLGTAAYGTVTLERRIPTALQTEYEGSWEYTEGYSIDDYVSFQYGSWEQYENSSGNDASIFDVTYTSTDANYSGTDTFTYTIQDEQGVQSTGTVTVTITGNQSPDAVADTATVVAGNSVVIDLLSNDSDPEGTTVSLVSLGTAAHGTVAQQRRIPAALQTEYEGSWEFTEGYSIDDYVSMYYGSWEQYENSSGNDATTFDVTYTSTDANYVGTDTFTYTIQDEQGVQSTGTVTVTVNENQAPTAVADTATVIAGNTVVIDILSNDSDPEGSTVSLVLLGTATYGTVALQRRIPAALQTEYEGSWEYSEGGYSIDDYVSMYYGSWEQYELSSGNDATTFDVVYTGTSATYVGTDSFTYTIQDEQGVQGSGTVSVTINENQAPAAITDTASVIAGYSVVINVLANDSDPEGSAVSLVSQGTAAHGTVTLERRIPAALQTEYEGSWEYSEGYSIDDYVSFMYGSWEQYEISSGNDASTFDVTYTSTDANYVGTDTFNYVVQDEQGVQNTGTVMITVNENQAPVVAADTTSVLAGNSVMIDVLANDSDPEGATVSLALLGTAAHGTVSLQRRIPAVLQTEYEGSWEYTMGGYTIDDYVNSNYGGWEQYENSSGNDASTFDVTYTSTDANYSGTDTFTYTIQDEQGVQSSGSVTITVLENLPPTVVADSASLTAGESTVVDVLANDSDPESFGLTLISVSGATHGAVSMQRRIPAALQTEYEGSWEYSNGYSLDDYVSMYYGSWEYYSQSSGNDVSYFDIKYTSNSPNYAGSDTFTYMVADEQGLQSTGSVTITVQENQNPDAINDTGNAVAGNPYVIHVLNNDSDRQGDSLTITYVSTPANGTASINADESITYTGNPGFGFDSFTYTVSDGNGHTDTATVSIYEVYNFAPVTYEDHIYDAPLGVPVTIDVLANDYDPDGEPISVIAVSDPTYGAAIINADGTITYIAEEIANGDAFQYTVSDPYGNTSTGVVSVKDWNYDWEFTDESNYETYYAHTDDADIAVGGNAFVFAQAIATDPSIITGAIFTEVPQNKKSYGTSATQLTAFGNADGTDTYGILSTGEAALVNDPGQLSSYDLGGGNVRGDNDYDVTVLKIDIDVPEGADYLSLDFQFLTEEFPGFIDAIYDDTFILELDQTTWTTSAGVISAPDNFATFSSGGLVNVSGAIQTGLSAENGEGTAYDGAGKTGTGDHNGAATTLLQARTPITAGAHTLYLSIFDQGDALNDTTVLLDRLTVGTSTATVSAGIANLMSVEASADDEEFMVGDPVLLNGKVLTNNLIASVTVNGTQVEAIDAGNNFFSTITLQPGVNIFEITATDVFGATSTTQLTLTGLVATNGPIDFQTMDDVSTSVTGQYRRTSHNPNILYADVAIHNGGQYDVQAPLLIGVINISEPSVRVDGFDGVTADGIPYYDFTGLLDHGDSDNDLTLASGESTELGTLAFLNYEQLQFTYDLVVLGQLNQSPRFITAPEVEVVAGQAYTYQAAAFDPDGDPLEYELLTAPTGMTIDSATGDIVWSPQVENMGTHTIVIETTDGKGGFDQQAFTISVLDAPPNRPPEFTSTPVIDAYVNTEYLYTSSAEDPDGDTLSYSVVSGPAGMINSETISRDWITWTPEENSVISLSGLPAVNSLELNQVTGVLSGTLYYHDEFYTPSFEVDYDGDGVGDVTVAGDATDSSFSLLLNSVQLALFDTIQVRAIDDFYSAEPLAWTNVDVSGVTFTPTPGFSSLKYSASTGVISGTVDSSLNLFEPFVELDYDFDGVYETRIAVNQVDGTFSYLVDDSLLDASGNISVRVTSYDNQQGGFSWTPTAADVGNTFLVTLQADDSQGGLAQQTYQIYVHPEAGNHAPVIVSEPAETLELPNQSLNPAQGDVDPEILNLAVTPGATTTETISITLPALAADFTTDVVIVVDTSNSMSGELAWLKEMIPDLDAALNAAGVTDNRFALVRYINDATIVGTNPPVQLTLVGPDNEIVKTVYVPATSVRAAIDDFVLPTDGDYTLIVGSQNGEFADPEATQDPQPYSFVIDQERDAAVAVSGMGDYQGSIQAGEESTITFDAPQGFQLYLDSLDGTSGNLRYQLRTPSGDSIILTPPNQYVSAGTAGYDYGPILLPEAGTYTLTVKGNSTNDTGNYHLRLVDINNSSTSLSLNTEIDDTVSEAKASQFYQFSGTAGQTVFYDTLSQEIYDYDDPNYDFDSYQITLVSPSGTSLFTSSEMFEIEDMDRGPVVLPESGDYTLIVSSNDTDAVDYDFQLLDLQTAGTLVTADTSISDSLTPAEETKVYRFDVTAGDEFAFDLTARTGTGSAFWELIDPYGRSVFDVNIYSTSASDQSPGTLLSTGQYSLIVKGGTANTGLVDYTFSIDTLGFTAPTPPTGTTQQFGDVVSGSLDVAGEQDTYLYTATAGQQVFFDSLDAVPTNLNVTLVSPSGQQLVMTSFGSDNMLGFGGFEGEGSQSPWPVTLWEPGTYQVEIESAQNQTGSYRFRFLDVSDQTTVNYGSIISGEPQVVEEQHVYHLSGQRGDRVSIQLDAFTDAASFVNKVAVEVNGGTEDGYNGIAGALSLPFRPDAAVNVILVTDENRDVVNGSLTYNTILAQIEAVGATLHSAIMLDIKADSAEGSFSQVLDSGQIDPSGTVNVSLVDYEFPEGGGGTWITVGETELTDVPGFESLVFDPVTSTLSGVIDTNLGYNYPYIEVDYDFDNYANPSFTPAATPGALGLTGESASDTGFYADTSTTTLAFNTVDASNVTSNGSSGFSELDYDSGTYLLTGTIDPSTGLYMAMIEVDYDKNGTVDDTFYSDEFTGTFNGTVNSSLVPVDGDFNVRLNDFEGFSPWAWVSTAGVPGFPELDLDDSTGVLSGTVDLTQGFTDYLVEIDYDQDGTADASVYADATTGEFNFAVNSSLINAGGNINVRLSDDAAQVLAWNTLDASALITFTGAGFSSYSLKNSTGTLSGIVDLSLAADDYTIEIDYDQNGTIDQTTKADEDTGEFTLNLNQSQLQPGGTFELRLKVGYGNYTSFSVNPNLYYEPLAVYPGGALGSSPADNAGTKEEYVDLAFDTGGTVWSLDQLRDGGLIANSFSNAFVSTLTSDIFNQQDLDLIATDPSVEFTILDERVENGVATFTVQFTGDTDAHAFDLQFIRQGEPGILYGSIPTTLQVGYLYDVDAIDADNDRLTYELIGDTHGASFNSETGILTWYPESAGDYQFTARVNDGRGGEDLQTWTVTVTESGVANIAPTLTAVTDLTTESEREISIQLTGADEDGDTLWYYLVDDTANGSPVPDGMTIDPTTGQINWTPTTAQEGSHHQGPCAGRLWRHRRNDVYHHRQFTGRIHQ
ncbi:Ig-like domain-containing protein [Gimesia sp.]|uniref:Ig-like domain-containing protein n=1 Tax=Gimesia sp. TaxID=2024833 RepID=UPI0025C2CA25|nr:Ig-like domain-containing protein [Gimesia sp.]